MLETLYPANRFSAQCLIRYIAGNLAHRARTRYVGFWFLVSFIVPNSGLLYTRNRRRGRTASINLLEMACGKR